MSIKKKIDEKVESLKGQEDVRAVAIVGSYAREPKMNHNDIDIYVIVKGGWRKRETFQENGVVWEVFYNSIDWIKTYFEEDRNWYTYHWLSNADVRHDPENLFEELEDLAEEWKENQFKVDKERLLYSIWDIQQDLDSSDVGQKRFMMHKAFNRLLDKHYLLKEEPLVKDNYKLKRMKDFDGYMYKLSQEFLMESSTMKKEQKLNKIIEHVTKNIGVPKPEWKTKKEFLN